MTDRPTILVLRALGLGDFVTGLPALALLRRERPQHRIVLAVPREFTRLALLTEYVDKVVHARELDPIVDPPHHPELAIDLHGNGPESRALLRACSPRQLLAYGENGRIWSAEEHEVHRWLRLLVEGLPADPLDLPGVVGALPVPSGVAVEPAGLTLVHVGAKAGARRWPAERFAAIARRLTAEGHRVLVTGGPRESAIVDAVASAAGVTGSHTLSLEELCVVVASARLVLSGDTGVAHLATNYRTPSVVLFGPVSPAVWGPPQEPIHQVLWYGDGRGDPHGDHPDPALLAITVDDVMAAIDRVQGRREEIRA